MTPERVAEVSLPAGAAFKTSLTGSDNWVTQLAPPDGLSAHTIRRLQERGITRDGTGADPVQVQASDFRRAVLQSLARVFDAPRFQPRADAGFEGLYDFVGDAGINVNFKGGLRFHGRFSFRVRVQHCAAPLPVGETGGSKGKKNHGRFARKKRKLRPKRSDG